MTALHRLTTACFAVLLGTIATAQQTGSPRATPGEQDLDFRLRPGAAAIDRGLALPNVNDGFAGKAPDLGALEAGQPLPTYGPRR